MARQLLFVSYARVDADRVLPVVEAVRAEYQHRAMDVDVWIDMDNLSFGEQWDAEITKALRDSIGILVFVSPAAMESDWVSREIIAAAEHQDRLILPVILRHVPSLPDPLATRQWLDLSERHDEVDLARAAKLIADATETHLTAKATLPPVTAAEAPEIATKIAQEARGGKGAARVTSKTPDSVFLVHGHDSASLSDVEAFLAELGVKSFVLSKVSGPEQSLLQKFLRLASDAEFAIVILSADDVGASCVQYDAEGVRDRALQFRARQNVILELGFFYGHLGWENVFVLYHPPGKVYPNFERPSDIAGAVFDQMEPSGVWRESLTRKLSEAGFRLTNKD